MARGTGLPGISQGPQVQIKPAPIVQADTSTASMWAELARQAGAIGDSLTDIALKEQKRRVAGYTAELDIQAERKAAELAALHPYDPDAFDKDWRDWSSGVLGQVDHSLVPHMRPVLADRGQQMFMQLAGERRTRDLKNAETAINSRLELAQRDALAAAGRADDDRLPGLVKTFIDIAESGAATGLWPQERAQELSSKFLSKTMGERMLGGIRQAFEASGADEARGLMDHGFTDPKALASLSPAERDTLRTRAEGLLKDLEDAAGATVLEWAGTMDPLDAYGLLQSGRGKPEAMAAYGQLSAAGQVKLRSQMLTLASQAATVEDRQERKDRLERERQTNDALYGLYSLSPADPDYAAKREEALGQVRALGIISPETYARLQQDQRNAGADDPELLFQLEDQVERGVIASADGLAPFVGRGLTYDTGRRLVSKLNQVQDERYRLGLARIKAAAGLVEGGLFAADSAEAKAASRMRIAFDDALDDARTAYEAEREAGKAPKPVDPVQIARSVIQVEENRKATSSGDPLQQTYQRTIDAAREKIKAAGITDPQGNPVVLDFSDSGDVEAARELLRPGSGWFGSNMGRSSLFTERELRELETALRQRQP